MKFEIITMCFVILHDILKNFFYDFSSYYIAINEMLNHIFYVCFYFIFVNFIIIFFHHHNNDAGIFYNLIK